MEMLPGNFTDVTPVIDLSKLRLFKAEHVFIYGLVDGSRLIAEKISENDGVLVVRRPYRIILRPMGMNKVSVEMTDFTIAADSTEADLSIRQSAVMFFHLPDKQILGSYADHINRTF